MATSIYYNGLLWKPIHPKADFEMLGFIPTFLNLDNPLLAAQQIDRAYGHGGGWNHFPGFTLLPNNNIKYPGDPETRLIYKTSMRDELIFFYEHSWLRIEQPDKTWQISRID